MSAFTPLYAAEEAAREALRRAHSAPMSAHAPSRRADVWFYYADAAWSAGRRAPRELGRLYRGVEAVLSPPRWGRELLPVCYAEAARSRRGVRLLVPALAAALLSKSEHERRLIPFDEAMRAAEALGAEKRVVEEAYRLFTALMAKRHEAGELMEWRRRNVAVHALRVHSFLRSRGAGVPAARFTSLSLSLYGEARRLGARGYYVYPCLAALLYAPCRVFAGCSLCPKYTSSPRSMDMPFIATAARLLGEDAERPHAVGGATPLHVAATAPPGRVYRAVLGVMLEGGVDPDARDREGATPLQLIVRRLASTRRRDTIADMKKRAAMLVAHGADVALAVEEARRLGRRDIAAWLSRL